MRLGTTAIMLCSAALLKTDVKGPGSLIYEPSTLVHQWGNAGDETFTFLVFNISPEGTPAVVPAAPSKAQ